MFDNLRDSADSSFYEDEPNDLYSEPAPAAPSKAASAAAPKQKARRRSSARGLGLTPQQRFILATMMFLTVCMMGTLAMFVLGKMSLF